LQHLHAAHGAAGDAEEGVDAEMIDETLLRAHHVRDGDDREFEAPGPVGPGIDLHGPARAHAAPEDVRADEEIAPSVQHLARSRERRPPSGLAGDGMLLGHVLVAGKRVADQDGVAALGVERAVGLVGDGVAAEARAAVERERLLHHEAMARALA